MIMSILTLALRDGALGFILDIIYSPYFLILPGLLILRYFERDFVIPVKLAISILLSASLAAAALYALEVSDVRFSPEILRFILIAFNSSLYLHLRSKG